MTNANARIGSVDVVSNLATILFVFLTVLVVLDPSTFDSHVFVVLDLSTFGSHI
jgi:hypothetical protein